MVKRRNPYPQDEHKTGGVRVSITKNSNIGGTTKMAEKVVLLIIIYLFL